MNVTGFARRAGWARGEAAEKMADTQSARRVGKHWLRTAVAGLLLNAALLFLAVNMGISAQTVLRPRSDHFDGERFFNPAIHGHERGFVDLLKWASKRRPPHWRERTDVQPGPPPARRAAPGVLRATFINHATVLVQMDGLNILTDPIWSDRASPVSWAGPQRVHPPGIRFEDLPPIDVVLLSHNHYDHMDVPTLRRLNSVHHPRFFTGLGNRAYLERRRIQRVTEMDWWDEVPLGDGHSIVFTPAQHFSTRDAIDHDRTLWGGFFVKGPAGALFFGGDTGYAWHFREVRKRLGAPRLALLPIGAYEPRWIMSQVHMNPADAVRAAGDLETPVSMGIHFGTFQLADDAQDQPPRDLRRALAAANLPADRFWVLAPGESRDAPAVAAAAASDKAAANR